MKIFYCDEYVLPLPPEHRFPMRKYELLRARLIATGIVTLAELERPPAATDEQILRAHDADYLDRVQHGRMSADELRRLGFPWSPELVERSRRSSGATIAASQAALTDGFGVNLAGGTHHAFRDRGEGYCLFNDSAIAARALQAEAGLGRVLIVDCDVHQGNGTAAILAGDETIFTFSIHGARNYPLVKERSDLDVELDDGTTDEIYLEKLGNGLEEALSRARAEAAIYLAGADPFHGDRFGRLAVTKEGLARRDALVLSRLEAAGLPVAVTMAGGYAPNVSDIVDIHWQTVRLTAQRARRRRTSPNFSDPNSGL